MKTAEIMTEPVVSVSPEATIEEAARLMVEKRISGLPVLDAGNLVGIVTEGDLIRRPETGTERRHSRWLEFFLSAGRTQEYVRSHARKVGEVMTRNVVSVDKDTSLGQVVKLMEQHGIKLIPVLENDRLVGIVSRANLVGALANALRVSAVEDRFFHGK